jgi:hypothetical protein
MGMLLLIGFVAFVAMFAILISAAVASQSRFRREMDRLSGSADDMRRLFERQDAFLDRAERLLDRLETRPPAEAADDAIRNRG